MTYSAKILADSIGPARVRITTMEVTFPRIILAELNTHRAFSRNSASSRAIPLAKMIERVKADPFIPTFAANQSGMQPGEELDEAHQLAAKGRWLMAMHSAVNDALHLGQIGAHKQWANRLLEPFMWHTAIVTSTEWENFFSLRCHPDAQVEIRTIAELMRAVLVGSKPVELHAGEWHLPLVDPEHDAEVPWHMQPLVSAGRCARVSYLTHDGRRDPYADLALCERLKANGHWSPMEHPCVALRLPVRDRNVVGWHQLRAQLGG